MSQIFAPLCSDEKMLVSLLYIERVSILPLLVFVGHDYLQHKDLECSEYHSLKYYHLLHTKWREAEGRNTVSGQGLRFVDEEVEHEHNGNFPQMGVNSSLLKFQRNEIL